MSLRVLPQQCPSLMVWRMCLVRYGADFGAVVHIAKHMVGMPVTTDPVPAIALQGLMQAAVASSNKTSCLALIGSQT